jgi:hypothetical protein
MTAAVRITMHLKWFAFFWRLKGRARQTIPRDITFRIGAVNDRVGADNHASQMVCLFWGAEGQVNQFFLCRCQCSTFFVVCASVRPTLIKHVAQQGHWSWHCLGEDCYRRRNPLERGSGRLGIFCRLVVGRRRRSCNLDILGRSGGNLDILGRSGGNLFGCLGILGRRRSSIVGCRRSSIVDRFDILGGR